MNDESLERHLKKLPRPELPAHWRGEILSAAKHEAHRASQWKSFSLIAWLRNFFVHNSITASGLTALWLCMFILRVTTPSDPAEQKIVAKIDPNHPIYLTSISDEIRLVELLQNPPEPRRPLPMP